MTAPAADVLLIDWRDDGSPVMVSPQPQSTPVGVTHLLERPRAYEPPLPLHQLTLDELQTLRDSMHGVLASFGRVSARAGMVEHPDWLRALQTEYTFVCDALRVERNEVRRGSR